MAAITLSAATWPAHKKATSVGTTLQLFRLPTGTKTVRVRASGAAFVQFAGADGGTVSADAFPLTANLDEDWRLRPMAAGPAVVLVAAASGTVDVHVAAMAE